MILKVLLRFVIVLFSGCRDIYIQVYNKESISNPKTQCYKLHDSIKKFKRVKPGLCFCASAVRNAFRRVITQEKNILFFLKRYFFLATTIRALALGHAGGRLVEYTNSALTAWCRTQKRTSFRRISKRRGDFPFQKNQH